MSRLQPPDLNPEELADKLDKALSQGRGGVPARDPRVNAALKLSNVNHPAMSPEMMARVQSKMVAAHRQQMRQRRTWRPQNSVFLRMVATFAIIFIFLSSTALPTFANSVPGDFWYPFKRNLEAIELSAATSPAARANVYLIQAGRRLDEAKTLLERRIFDTDLMIDVRDSLANFSQQAAQAGGAMPDREEQAALVTESMSILIQEAEQLQVVTGSQAVALLPTLLPLPSAAPTDVPSETPSETPVPPTEVTVVVVTDAPQVEVTEVPTIEEPTEQPSATPVPSETPTDIPTPTYTPTVEASATTPPLSVTMYALENANVRSQPGQDQAVITILHRGESAAVIGEDDKGKWWRVQLQDGQLGWIAKFLLSVNAPPAAADNTNGNGADNANNPSGNCEHPGNYCNAPGQTGTLPAQSNGNGNPGSGKPDNPGGGNPPANPGGGRKP